MPPSSSLGSPLLGATMRIQTSAANTLRDLALGLAGAIVVGLLWSDREDT